MNVNMIKKDSLIWSALDFIGFSIPIVTILFGGIYALSSTCTYGEKKKALLEMELYKGKSATVEYANKKRIESIIHRESSPQIGFVYKVLI